MSRGVQTCCQFEPSYDELADVVVFSIRSPEMTAHFSHPDCPIEEPHQISSCGLWKDK